MLLSVMPLWCCTYVTSWQRFRGSIADQSRVAYRVATRKRFLVIIGSPVVCCLVSGGNSGLVSIYEVVPNPNHAPPSPPDDVADPQLRAGVLAHSNEEPNRDRCPLLLQLVTHMALENLSGMVKDSSIANW